MSVTLAIVGSLAWLGLVYLAGEWLLRRNKAPPPGSTRDDPAGPDRETGDFDLRRDGRAR